ncbi:hypothetical protein GCK72_016675 [Caenorhabditis remanei]|uniref:Uncharacterized protein n=1 Tax=Caenorhabditis remanei TaxID=31234 RepID=A0A6A5G6L5_CAERE|nr:hypothetical protein GCK72_016675 [Caenorhabditis remanei]KAF1750129.1 hypothetical protein GCK72_016675 [Caenorhabditis remanei]
MADEEEEWRFPNHYFQKCSQLVGLIATLVFLSIVIYTFLKSPKIYAPSGIKECERAVYRAQIEMDHIEFEDYVSPDFKAQFPRFFLVQYIMDGVGPDDNYPEKRKVRAPQKRREVPVFITPGRGDLVDSHLLLAKIVTDLTERKDYYFRFYAVHLHAEAAHWSWPHYRRIRLYTEMAYDYVQKLYPGHKMIRICHAFGGPVGFAIPMSQYSMIETYEKLNRDPADLPDLFIFESVPTDLPGYYEKPMQEMVRLSSRDWAKNQANYSLGMVSFDAGYDDTTVDPSWLKLRYFSPIPVWTIDGVPDNGLTTENMLTCKPVLSQIAELLISYAEKQANETGASIAKAFYEKWEKKMQATLPDGWEKDPKDPRAVLTYGMKVQFPFNETIWLDISTDRAEHFYLMITGSCLSSATLVRQNKYVIRKEKQVDSNLIEFGIFQVKKFEPMKLLLESNGECNVEISYAPHWLIVGIHRFYYSVVTDPHYFWVGAQIVSIYLFVLESDRRSFRLEHHFYLYIAFMLAVRYHMFDRFGFERSGAGIVLGGGFALTLHYFASFVDEFYFNRHLKRNLDSYTTPHYRNNFFKYMIISVIAHIHSSSVGAAVAVILFSVSSRLFLTVPFILSHLPNFYAAYDSSAAFSPERRQIWVGCAMCVTGICAIGHFASSQRLAPQATREIVHAFAFACFICQIFMAHKVLDFHYATGFFVLAVNHYAPNHVPDAIFQKNLDLNRLEREYEELGDNLERRIRRRF